MASYTGAGLPSERHVNIACPSGFTRTVAASVCVQSSLVAVIACHPWGLLGGSMHDIVVHQAVSVFKQAGCTTARFNFRSGLGRGWQSTEDVRLVANYLLHELPATSRPKNIIIVGYSYGSIPGAAAAADIPEVIGFAMISPPLDWWAAGALYCFNSASLIAQARDSEGLPKSAAKP